MSDLLPRLDREWNHLARSRATRAMLHAWATTEPDLTGLADLEQLRAAVHDRTRPERADRLLAALVRLAAADHGADRLAARVVLQLLLPGAARLSRQLAAAFGGGDAALAVVLGELTIGIRSYPWRRRPGRIAANLLLDTRQRLLRWHRRSTRELLAGLHPHHHPPATHDTYPAIDLRDLLTWAIRRDVINPFEARLLVAWHVAETPVPQLVTRFGRSRSTLFHARALAESKLRDALTHQAGQPR